MLGRITIRVSAPQNMVLMEAVRDVGALLIMALLLYFPQQ